MDISGINYFIPFGSPKYDENNTKKILNKQITINLPDDMGYINFNNMIPHLIQKVKTIRIKEEHNEKYKRLLEN